jgi:hypothetical protein
MAEIQDIEGDVGELETVAAEIEAQSAESNEVKPESIVSQEFPERYRGKTVKEIIEIAEKDKSNLGRYANEAGELRRLTDELIKSQLKPKEQEEQPKEVDFFENPQEAIRRQIETNPHVQQAQQYGLQAMRAQAQQKLMQLHPDFGQVVQDAEFAKWVGESKVRVKLFKEAEGYDVDAADELLSTFKQLRAVKAPPQVTVSDEEKSSRTKTLQAAAVDTGGSGESSRKIYRRADLIRLKMTNPAKYEAMSDEILAAYAEKRVK